MAAFDDKGSGGSQRAIDTLTRLTPIQKIALGAAALTVVGGTMVLTQTSNEIPMAAVYTDLEARDAASVTDELIARNVDYELADGGRTVLVPREDVYDLRIALSGEGLPTANEGYALLDRQGITTSEFRQRIDFQRALEGELAMTLRSIDGIDSATVHLALPEDSVFVDEPEQATASVLVRSSNPTAIGGDQVAAMVHLVASSVKGMSPDAVTIADATGVVLTDGAAGGVAGGGRDARSQATSAVEQDLAASLRTMVGRVTGYEHVAVSVQADLELTQRQETTERFDTSDQEGDGVVIAERTAVESYTGTDAEGDTGVLGPDGATLIDETIVGGDKTYTKDDAERTFAVNRTVEQTTITPGEVRRLHVAVLVDEAAVTDAQSQAIAEMISAAAGIDIERGDQVVVTRLPFDTAAVDAAAEAAVGDAAAAAAEQQSSLIRTGIIAFLVLIAMLLAYRSARRARREVSTPIDIGAIRAASLNPGETPGLGAGDNALTDADSVAVRAARQAASTAGASQAALEELGALADRRPEEVAQILQSWLADERSSV
jgi:flagellar M-ring protein FliF